MTAPRRTLSGADACFERKKKKENLIFQKKSVLLHFDKEEANPAFDMGVTVASPC